MPLSLHRVLEHPSGRRASTATAACALCAIFLIYVVSVTRSLVLTGAAWLSVFSFFALFSAIVSMAIPQKCSENYTFGLVRAPVVAVFSTAVLAQLSAVFLTKESVEQMLETGHHHGGHPASNYHFYSASIVVTIALFLAAYAVPNQPFQYVLTSSHSSVLQEHAADISHAICYVVPGLSRILLPRINALSLLAFICSACCIATHWFLEEFWWFDAVAALVLSFSVFSTMMPLSSYTGRVLLQTTPPHVHNQIDRCISEASTVDGVLELRNLHFWQLDFSQIAGTVDVRVRRDANEQMVLALVTEKLHPVVHILTVQVLKDVTTTFNSAAEYGAVPSASWTPRADPRAEVHGLYRPPEPVMHHHSDVNGHAHHDDHDDHHGHSHSHHGHGHSH